MDARRTKTCVASRHVDTSRDFCIIFSQGEAWGALPNLLFYIYFPVQQTTSSESVRFQDADRFVDYSYQYDDTIVSLVSFYDTYLGGLFIRLTSPFLFSSLGTNCGVSYLHQ